MYSWRVVGRMLRGIIYDGRISGDDFGRLQQGDGSAPLVGERVPGGEIGQESENVDAAVRIDADDQKNLMNKSAIWADVLVVSILPSRS